MSVRDEEAACFEVFRRVTGFAVTPHDHSGRQAAVDGMVEYPDGRTAAVEVTSLAADGRQQLESLLAADSFKWTCQASWRWLVSIGDPADVPRAKRILHKVVTSCEAQGASRPEQLDWRTRDADEDLTWAADGSVIFHGIPTQAPPRDDAGQAVVYVHPSPIGGFIDETLETFDRDLCAILNRETVVRRAHKVGGAEADERHLMIVLHATASSMSLFDAFINGADALPPSPPSCLSERVTHLWLVPTYGRRVLVWTGMQWQAHMVFDN